MFNMQYLNQEMARIYSIVKLLPIVFYLFGFIHAQKIPHEYRSKCTVAENAGCFTDALNACPPGYHRNHEYTECSHRRHCCPCPQGSFQPQRNLCYSCIECKNCSKTNQEVSALCNATHDTECGDTLTTNIPEVSDSEELVDKEETAPPDTTPEPDEDITTEAPVSTKEVHDVCPSSLVLLVTHLACVMVGVILCNLRKIFEKIKSCVGPSYSYQPSSSSLEEGAATSKRRKGKKSPARKGKQKQQATL